MRNSLLAIAVLLPFAFPRGDDPQLDRFEPQTVSTIIGTHHSQQDAA